MYPVVGKRIGTVYPFGSNKGFSSIFCVKSRVWYEAPEEGQRIYWPKSYEYNNKDEMIRILVEYTIAPYHDATSKDFNSF